MKYFHIPLEDDPEEVSSVQILDDGYVSFRECPYDEFSVQDLKDIISEAEYELDTARGNDFDFEDDDLALPPDDSDDFDDFNSFKK